MCFVNPIALAHETLNLSQGVMVNLFRNASKSFYFYPILLYSFIWHIIVTLWSCINTALNLRGGNLCGGWGISATEVLYWWKWMEEYLLRAKLEHNFVFKDIDDFTRLINMNSDSYEAYFAGVRFISP